MENSNTENTKSEPHVTVFGEEVGNNPEVEPREKTRRCMCGRHDRCHCGGGVFGLVLIAVGVILFLNYTGVVSWVIWKSISVFWPAILVLIGLKIVLGRSAVGRAVYFLLALAIIAFIVWYGLNSVNSPLIIFAKWPWQPVDIINAK